MKIRNGFVSNSSSSSFIIVVDKEAYEKTLAAAHPFIQAAINKLPYYNRSSGKIMGRDVIMLGYFNSAGGNYTWDDMHYDGPDWMPDGRDGEDYLNNAYEAVDAFISLLPEGTYITGNVGDGG